jgi:DNA polymerase-4
MLPRSVIFIDPPAFCTTLEGLVAPALRSRPLAVAAPGADRATVLALSPEARRAGIARGMAVHRARKICPDLILLPPNPRLYARASRALHEIFRQYAPVIEPKGYGHAFLDLTGTAGLFGPAVDVGSRIQREARERVRLPVSVGVATNKLVSQAATTVAKEETDGSRSDASWPILQVPLGGEALFLAPQRVEILPDLAPRTLQRLDDYQLELIGDVAVLEERQICAVFPSEGPILLARARGVDPRPVLPPERKAEFRATHTLASDTNDLGLLHALLRRLAEQLGHRLRLRQLVARRLTVSLAYADYATARQSLPLVMETGTLDVELWDAARRAFTQANRRTVALRAVGVKVDRFLEADVQMELWTSPPNPLSTHMERGEEVRLQNAVDRIRKRWGWKAVRASA